MKNISKRLIGWLLCICMVLSYLPAVSLVANADEYYTGRSASKTITNDLGEDVTVTVKTLEKYAIVDNGPEEWYVSELSIRECYFGYANMSDKKGLHVSFNVRLQHDSGDEYHEYVLGMDPQLDCGYAVHETPSQDEQGAIFEFYDGTSFFFDFEISTDYEGHYAQPSWQEANGVIAYCCEYCEPQCWSHDFDNGICKNCGGYEECDSFGTQSYPYEIDNVGCFLWFAMKVNNGDTNICGKLTKSIDLSGYEWPGIGTAEYPFTGTFDGDNRIINGLTITATGSNHGLFGVVNGGTVKNILELHGNISVSATDTTPVSNVGGAVGQAYGGATIENVTSYVNINDTGKTVNGNNNQLGGVVGFVNYDDTTGAATVKNCEYRGTINMQNAQIVGGVVGGSIKKGIVTECVNYGNITAGADAKHIGGVLGNANSGTEVTLCRNVGNVTSGGADCIGGVVAYANEQTKIENCYNLGRVTCTNASGGYIGGILGYINNNSFGGLKNCFNYGKIITNSGSDNHAGSVAGWVRNSNTSMIQNNYWLDTTYTAASGGNAISATAYDEAAFESGIVTWKLNGESPDGVWGQTLGDLGAYRPDFDLDGEEKVYYGYLTCTGEMTYTNTPCDSTLPHVDDDSDHLCDVCGTKLSEHSAVYVSAHEGTCDISDPSWYEHYHCEFCGKYWTDEALTQEVEWEELKYYRESHGKTLYTNITDDTHDAYCEDCGADLGTGVAHTYTNGLCVVCGHICSHSNWTDGVCNTCGSVCAHVGWTNGVCNLCGTVCAHVGWTNGACDLCGTVCAHENWTDGVCDLCGAVCGHPFWTAGVCDFCGTVCAHESWTDGVCDTCALVCPHTSWTNGVCDTCALVCPHTSWTNGVCDTCGTVCAHESWTDGVCDLCGTVCAHASWTAGVCDTCALVCPHTSWTNGVCDTCATVCAHASWTNGVCGTCATVCTHATKYDGFCTVCGKSFSEPKKGTDGVYEIGTVAELYWFAQAVNSGSNELKARLIDDIYVNYGIFDGDGNYDFLGTGETPRAWIPIGNAMTPFYAEFDGNHHTIYGLYCCVENGLAGFIGNMRSFSVKDLTIDCSYFEGETAGAIAAYSDGTTYNCCAVGEDVYVNGDEAGGLVGDAGGGGTIYNCYSLAAVTGKNYGGLVGSNAAAIKNCYTNAMRPVGSNNASYGGSMTNVYYAVDTTDYSEPDEDGYTVQKPTFTGATEVEEKDFSSGKLAFTLQSNVEEECLSSGYTDNDGNWVDTSTYYTPEVWKQTIDRDDYPNFTGKKVYPMTNVGCQENGSERYSNTENATYAAEHSYDNGFCECGAYEPATKGDDGVYQIGNAGQLYWFASLVNGSLSDVTQDIRANAKLVANITVNPGTFDENGGYEPVGSETARTWTPIGNGSSAYIGTFDGAKNAEENFTVSGLYFNDDTSDYVGLFGYLGFDIGQYGTVKNVTLENSYFKGNEYVGGIAGQNYRGYIINCHNTGVAVYGTEDVGGITGKNSGPVEECSNKATVCADNYCVGGISGNSSYPGTVVSCSNSGEIKAPSYAGGIVGQNSGTVMRCFNTWQVQGTKVGGLYIGGIVGYASGNAKILNCYNNGMVAAEGYYVGGIVGVLYAGEAENCYNYAPVSGDYYVGAIAGASPYSDAPLNCYYLRVYDVVDGAECVQNGIGNAEKGSSTPDEEGECTAMTKSSFTSGEVTYKLNGGVTDGTQAWYQTCGDLLPDFDGKTVYKYTDCSGQTRYVNEETEDESHYFDDYGFCECGADQPAVKNDNGVYEIGNAGQLYWFSGLVNGYLNDVDQDTAADAKLVADIVVNPGTVDEEGNYVSAKSEDARLWSPIGYDQTVAYTGNFDGAKNESENYTISGIYAPTVDGATNKYIGLFGYMGIDSEAESYATVKNVTLKNCYFEGDQFVGGIAGQNNGGHIINCHNTGVAVYAQQMVGGIVGMNSWDGQIICCSNAGKVRAEAYVGGIVGYFSGTMKCCYNTEMIEGTGKAYVGGIAGYLRGTISDCYNTGAIFSKAEYVGGIAGAILNAKMENCYNYASVTGETYYVGAIIGHNWSSTLNCSNCYYPEGDYAEDGAQCVQNGSGAGTKGSTTPDEEGKFTAMPESSFRTGEITFLLNGGTSEAPEGEDLVWYQTCDVGLPDYEGEIVYRYTDCQNKVTYLNEKKTDGHQYLNGFCTICGSYQPCEGEGTEASPYLIANGGNLYWFAAKADENSGIYGELTKNIKVNESVLAEDGSLNVIEGRTLRSWTPICPDKSNPYYGIFDGKNFTISGLYFDDTTSNYIALFGCIGRNADGDADGKVKNVKIADSYFNGKGWVAALVGHSRYGTVENCTSSATIKGNGNYVGGIVADNRLGDIIKCSNSGNISSTATKVGGIVGGNTDGQVKNCHNSGNVTSTSTYSDADVGGVCGSNGSGYNGLISDCYNTGDVSCSGQNVGGVVGYQYYAKTQRCYNTGNVSSEYGYVGGVCGYLSGGEVLSCYNTGDISTEDGAVGGLVGTNLGTIMDGYTIGNVTGGSQNVGAVIGCNTDDIDDSEGWVEDCYYLEGCAKASGGIEQYGIGSLGDPEADVTGKTIAAKMSQFESGEIAYLLNDGYTDPTEAHPVEWRQNLVKETADTTDDDGSTDDDASTDNGTDDNTSADGDSSDTSADTGDDTDGSTDTDASTDGNDTGDGDSTDGDDSTEGDDSGETTVKADKSPNFTGKIVYYGYISCAADAQKEYSNDENASETKPAHSETLECIDNGDGTHKTVCPTCSETITESEAHTYTPDGICPCGAAEATGPIAADDLVFASKSLSLQSYTQFNFAVKVSVLKNYDSWYITTSRYDYNDAKLVTETIAGSSLTANLWLFSCNLYSFMLNDDVTVTLYAEKDGVTYVGETYVSSVASYAIEKLPSSSESMKTMYANMLNYGAMAQIYMNYNAENLATANLGTYSSYITATLPTMENINSVTSTGATGLTFSRWALGTSDSVKLQLAVKQGTVTDASTVYAKVSWTRNGKTIEQTIDGSEFVAVGKQFVVVIDGLTATEGRTPVSVTFYNKTTDEAVSETMTSSIASYVANNQTLSNTAQVNVLNALLNYYDSAAVVYG